MLLHVSTIVRAVEHVLEVYVPVMQGGTELTVVTVVTYPVLHVADMVHQLVLLVMVMQLLTLPQEHVIVLESM